MPQSWLLLLQSCCVLSGKLEVSNSDEQFIGSSMGKQAVDLSAAKRVTSTFRWRMPHLLFPRISTKPHLLDHYLATTWSLTAGMLPLMLGLGLQKSARH